MAPFLKDTLHGILGALLFLGASAVPSISSFAQETETRADIVEMEKMEIVAKRYQWRYARIDNFEILSGLDNDKQAAEIIQNALKIIDVFRTKSPLFGIKRELPVRIILIKDQAMQRFVAAIDERLGARIEESAGVKRQRLVRPELQGKKPGAYAVPRENVFRLEKLDDEQAQILMYIPEAHKGRSNNYYAVSILMDAYFRLCLASNNIKNSNLTYTFANAKILALDSGERGRMPSAESEVRSSGTVWYAVKSPGVLIRRYDLKAERIIFRHLASDYDKTSPKALSEFMAAPWLDLRDVLENPQTFRIAYDETNTMQAVENYITYKRQISDFSIYCIFSPDERVRAGYIKLLNAVNKNPPDEALFMECFGTGYAQFQGEMYAYYRTLGKDYYTGVANRWGSPEFTIPIPKDKPAPRPVFRATSQSERSRIFAEWFWACKAPHLAREFLAKAGGQSAQARTDPEFLASSGLYEARAGDKTKALDLLEKAALFKTTRPAAYRALAQLRFEDIKAKQGGDHRLTNDEIDRVIGPLEIALGIPRHHPKTCMTLVRALRSVDANPPEKLARALADGCLENPEYFPLLVATVPLLRRSGMDAAADKLLDAASKGILSDSESRMLEKLRAGHHPPPPPAWDATTKIE